MPSILNSDSGAVSGSAGLKFDAADDGILEIQNSGNTAIKLSDSFLKVPTGNTAQRPASPENGMIRFNSDTGELEGYLGGAWKRVAGNEPALKLDFDEYQFDGRISFTRATNGSYFDSAGVLTTAGSGVPRLDHRLEGGVWVNKGLLIEEQRINLATRSEEFNDSIWTKQNSTITSNAANAPDGNTTADKLLENTTNGQHRVYRTISGTTNTNPYTLSVFAKKSERDRLYIGLVEANSFVRQGQATFDLTNGTIIESNTGLNGATGGYATITDVGNGWYRCTYTVTLGGSNTNIFIDISIVSSGTTISYAGTNNFGLFIWGAQLEAGAFPTSYIATTSASVTRNADLVSMTGTNFSSWYNQTEGTMFCQADGQDPKFDTTEFKVFFQWSVSNNTSNERIQIANRYDTGTSTNQIRHVVNDGNVAQVVLDSFSGSWSTTTQYKTANAYKVNDFAATTNGAAVVTDTSGTLPTVDRLYLGVIFDGSLFYLNGHIAKFYYWPTRQPNAKLVSLTQ
jgi:hypothetical protein